MAAARSRGRRPWPGASRPAGPPSRPPWPSAPAARPARRRARAAARLNSASSSVVGNRIPSRSAIASSSRYSRTRFSAPGRASAWSFSQSSFFGIHAALGQVPGVVAQGRRSSPTRRGPREPGCPLRDERARRSAGGIGGGAPPPSRGAGGRAPSRGGVSAVSPSETGLANSSLSLGQLLLLERRERHS